MHLRVEEEEDMSVKDRTYSGRQVCQVPRNTILRVHFSITKKNIKDLLLLFT